MKSYVVLILIILESSLKLFASGRFYEFSLKLPDSQKVKYEFLEEQKALHLHFLSLDKKNQEILYNYDDSLVKRVVMKQNIDDSLDVQIYFKDAHISVSLDYYEEPYRLQIAVFDKNYSIDIDPKTKIPLSSVTSGFESQKEIIADNGDKSVEKNSSIQISDKNEISKKYELLHDSPAVKNDLDTQKGNSFDATELEKIPSKIGDKWETYPIYIYRIQTASYLSNDNQKEAFEKANMEDGVIKKALFAYTKFSLGDENQALFLYKKLLYENSRIFELSPTHIWTLGEIYLGIGEMSLAKGYYQALIDRFSDHELAFLARMRILDMEALSSILVKNFENLTQTLQSLEALALTKNMEINAQILIRKIFWKFWIDKKLFEEFPVPNTKDASELNKILKDLESQKTIYIGSSLVFRRLLEDDVVLSENVIVFGNNYFSKFDPKTQTPFPKPLYDLFMDRLSKYLLGEFDKKNYLNLVQTLERVGLNFVKNIEDPKLFWIIAESLRTVNSFEKSLQYYILTLSTTKDLIIAFKSRYWISYYSSLIAKNPSDYDVKISEIKKYESQSKVYDSGLWDSWGQFIPQDKHTILMTFASDLSLSVDKKLMLKTPIKIIFEKWKNYFSQKSDDSTPKKEEDQPADNINQIIKISNQLRTIGLVDESNEALSFLKNILPKTFLDNEDLIKIWSDNLMKLSEIYREKNQFINAGELLVFLGDSLEKWGKRAEVFYKGGLLIYQGGNKQKAQDALTKASQDGGNMFYSNLAKERLNQLQ